MRVQMLNLGLHSRSICRIARRESQVWFHLDQSRFGGVSRPEKHADAEFITYCAKEKYTILAYITPTTR